MADVPFRTIVFDLDGTLADTAPDIAAAVNAALVSLGRVALDVAAVRTMVGHGGRATLRDALDATGGSDAALVDAGYAVLVEHYALHICDFTRPYPGVEQALDDLAARGVTLAVCTNKSAALASRLVEALGWQGRFAALVGGDTLAVGKPDPAPLRLAIERAGGGPAAFVGDMAIDMQTAAAAGVPGIAVSFGFADRPARELGGDRVIDHYAELVPMLIDLGRVR